MKLFSIVCAFLCATGIPSMGGEPVGQKETEALRETISQLHSQMVNRAVHRLDVLHLPNTVQTIVGLHPEDLKQAYTGYRLSIAGAVQLYDMDAMFKALQGATVSRREYEGDLRWGFVFYDKDGKELASFYTTGFLDEGVVGNVRVTYDRRLATWIKKQFGCCMRGDRW